MLPDIPTLPRRRSRARRWLRRSGVVAALAALLLGATDVVAVSWLDAESADHIFSESAVPAAPVGLVLGAQVEADGSPSVFLTARLELARRLFQSGKVRVLLLSGDHMNWDYDEPEAMRRWLVAHGVPNQALVLDYAGFDTYDSCARAVRVFGVHQAIVVTQTFHLPRAVTLCRRLGLDASGVGDDSVRQFRGPWLQGSVREYGASLKAVYDVVTGRDPVYLGRHETGVEDALHSG